MCVDFQDLSNVSPKDDFPLPHIGRLVNKTVEHHPLPFIDGYDDYNPTKMGNEDQQKKLLLSFSGTLFAIT